MSRPPTNNSRQIRSKYRDKPSRDLDAPPVTSRSLHVIVDVKLYMEVNSEASRRGTSMNLLLKLLIERFLPVLKAEQVTKAGRRSGNRKFSDYTPPSETQE